MKLYYDLHIHTCLSPCGDNDMTPNNIVNMAIIKGLDVIAITDHNHAGNVMPCIEAAKNTSLMVIGGMEVETAENIHMVVLFEDISKLFELEKIVQSTLPPVKNKPDIFGDQILMNSDDSIKGYEDRFIITACGLDIFDLYHRVTDLGGVIFPAHADKSSYSVISNLGAIPPELDFTALEVKSIDNAKKFCNNYKVISNSDAHYLWDISEREHYIDTEYRSITDVLYNLQQKQTL